jgi:membrane protease YdiL (CAAX protease family)
VLAWFTRQRVPTATLRFRDLAGETRWLLGFTLLYIVAAVATGLAIRAARLPLWGATDFLQDFWYTVVFKIGLLLVVPCVVFARRGYRPRDLLYGWRLTPWSALGLLAAFAIGVGINLGRVDSIRAAAALHPPAESVARIAAGVLIAFLQAGFPEEIVYRGLLQTRLEAMWGRALAIIVTVVLFVAWHLPTRFLLAHGIEGEAGDLMSVLVGTGIPVGVVAVLLGLAWDRWRNLPVLIALHGGIDTLPIVASMIQVPQHLMPGR